MAETDSLTDRFEAHRDRLRAVAFRMLGSAGEADDAVQEAWLRLARGETSGVENLGGWLTTVVARVCLDMLRARKSRREDALDAGAPAIPDPRARPDAELAMADSVGLALLVVLETLAPAERIAFVLHDLFDVPFDDIAPIVGRSPDATRQIASRARRRVQGVPPVGDGDRARQRRIVDAFIAASRGGDLGALLAVLDPDAVLRADAAAIAAAAAYGPGAPLLAPETRSAAAVAGALSGRARGAVPALIDGLAGAAWAPGGVVRAVFRFTLAGERIASIEIIVDPGHIAELDVVLTG